MAEPVRSIARPIERAYYLGVDYRTAHLPWMYFSNCKPC